ncbi:hypothetical protein TRVL_06505 [Trypanosoma vivax]|nr:hypothetical protein TRVL_06505 [Trypanosoma vivax]
MLQNMPFAGVPTYRQGYLSPSGVKVQYSKDWAKHHPLEGDGLRPMLYMHLWKKNKGSESKLKNIRLPDTVVYEHNFPRAWYTYDAEAREINKHPGKMLDAQSIYQHFSRTTSGCEIVAQFLTTCSVDDPDTLTPDGELLSYMEVFTAESLRDFLFNQSRKPDGILQKFVLPKSETTMRRSSQLQVSWSPLMTVVYKRTNKYHLNDTRVPVHKRAATFGGSSYLSELALVADETKNRLDVLCREVVEHVYFTDRKLITRMVLNFVIDEDNKPWLLWCSSLRVSGDSLNPRNVRIPPCLSMRIEMVNDGSSTKERVKKQLERQRNLLVMDVELYELSLDCHFGHQCNASHVREAQRMGLTPHTIDSPRLNAKIPKKHPFRNAVSYFTEAFAEDSKSSGVDESHVVNTSHRTSGPVMSYEEASVDESPEQRVKNELTAMTLDAWYLVYSSVLSELPSEMPTRLVELAEPLVVVLRTEELQQLVDILGLVRIEHVTKDGGGDGSAAKRKYRVKAELLRPGKRIDRPFSSVERDVREFFEQLFITRGQEVTQQCLANEKWIW